jgi:hypothetical protein
MLDEHLQAGGSIETTTVMTLVTAEGLVWPTT